MIEQQDHAVGRVDESLPASRRQNARWRWARLSEGTQMGPQDAERHNGCEEWRALLANGHIATPFAEIGRAPRVGERRALRAPDSALTEWTARSGRRADRVDSPFGSD